MKRTLLLLASVTPLLLAACTSESNLPTPTGKGAVRAINAIAGSPEMNFIIEETLVSIDRSPVPPVTYKNSTPPAAYDDFSYDFRFEFINPGDSTVTILATQTLKIDADQEHILLVSGSLDAPAITVWTGASREFSDTDTAFEVRFAHASPTLGNVDVYFEDPAVVPGTNPPAATLAFGEIADAADFEEGVHVMTVTAEGDPGVVHFTSQEVDLLPRFAHVMTIFDGDASDTAPVLVRSMTTVGNPLTLTDANYPPQIRLVHGANTLQTVDVYDDEALTSLVVGGLDFRTATAYLDAGDAERTFYFTPAGSTATVLYERIIPAPIPGAYKDLFLFGDTDNWSSTYLVPNRALATNAATLRLFNAALNHPSVDVYSSDRGAELDDNAIALIRATYGAEIPTVLLQEGNIDLYFTVAGEETVIAGPYPVDATLNSTLELLLVDVVDPLFAEIVDITQP